VVAGFLGMTEEQLHAARLEGKSLADIAGTEKDDLIKAIVSDKAGKLEQLVKDGKLTETQAGLMIENMTARVQTMVERTDVGPAAGQGGMRSGMGRGCAAGAGISSSRKRNPVSARNRVSSLQPVSQRNRVSSLFVSVVIPQDQEARLNPLSG